MAKYLFEGTLYRNAREMCEGMAGEWLSAGGLNGRDGMLKVLLEKTDQELTDELVSMYVSMYGTDFDEWLSENDASREMIVDAFVSIRADFDDIFPPDPE